MKIFIIFVIFIIISFSILEELNILESLIEYINKIKDYFYREKVNFIELKEFYYYYYDEMERFMRIFSEKYSDIIKLYSIGFSVQGRYLWVLEIIDNLGKYESGQLIFLFVNIFQYYFIIEKLKVD